ncbi:RbsD/FucU family protein [Pseudactinotalea sp. HY158]|uniref:RbsD/FucU family protein n=1 Tax=Pseudactinotalea sp. HY158 TaxID=2654547 RepID=UPI00129D03E1|nr:RbsD/FucU domain-containing protein [Pseudactinotalea sp. HY158]QGH68476.1 transport protein RbsD/FucU [Pseudactinotalea sp. HY158]
MLTGIHPILTGRVLRMLDELGHGDSLVVADANFPAHTLAADALDLPGLASPQVLTAVRTVVPADDYEGPSVQLMEAEPGIDVGVQRELRAAAGVPADRVELVERFEFYERARAASAIIRTGELRPYGNVILRKGVVSVAAQSHAPGNGS